MTLNVNSTMSWCAHGAVYGPGWSCGQCGPSSPTTHAETFCGGCAALTAEALVLIGQRADAQAEAARLREQLEAAEARIATDAAINYGDGYQQAVRDLTRPLTVERLAEALHAINRYCHDPEDLDAHEHEVTAAAVLAALER